MSRVIRLLEWDHDLGNSIDDERRRGEARETLTVPGLKVHAGASFDLGSLAAAAPDGIVILSGFLIRELATARRSCAELLGPEDVAKPVTAQPTELVLPVDESWTALTDVNAALLPADFVERAAPWPELARAMLERVARPGRRLMLARAIASLPTIDARLLASLWQWASQWSVVVMDGVALRVPLSHERIGRLIGAQRQTVTSAVGRLRAGGYVEQRPDGTWLLLTPEPAALTGADDQANGDGKAMPLLEGMIHPRPLGVRAAALGSSAQQRSRSARALLSRLSDQRAALEVEAERHREIYARFQSETKRMAIVTAEIAAVRQRVAHTADSPDAPEERTERRPEE